MVHGLQHVAHPANVLGVLSPESQHLQCHVNQRRPVARWLQPPLGRQHDGQEDARAKERLSRDEPRAAVA